MSIFLLFSADGRLVEFSLIAHYVRAIKWIMNATVVQIVVGDEALSPDDYEVASVARECEDSDRGNECVVDVDELGVTCYSSCTSHYCNDETRRPTWQDLLRRRVSRTRPSKTSVDRPPPPRQTSDPGDSRLPDTCKLITNSQACKETTTI